MKSPNPNPIRVLLDRLELWLKKHRPHFRKGLQPGATAAQLDELVAKLGMSVPDELRALLAWHNGQGEGFIGRFEQDWLLMAGVKIASAKADLDQDAAATGWDPAWIPFLDNDAGDFLCLDTSQAKAPVRGFWLGEKEHEIVAASLGDWLADFVANVEMGNYVEDPERGSFLRRSQV